MTGLLNLVSMGPGSIDQITPAAFSAIDRAEVVVGYELYLRPLGQILEAKHVIALPLTQERERANAAIANARQGKNVALVSSGDIGIYAMATLAFEQMTEADTFEVKVFPGITAANACAALLGAPLSHDFATLSLSDLLCPWSEIEARASHIAAADLAVALYNVQSKTRQTGIYKIIEIMLQQKAAHTKCGVVQNAYRPGQSIRFRNLIDLLDDSFDMFSTIVIGNKYTQIKRNWIYTPRGYSTWPELPKLNTQSFKPEALNQIICASKEVVPTPKPIPQPAQENFTLPQNAIWVYSGTGDGNALASKLLQTGCPLVLSVASSYGAELAALSCPQATIISGRIGAEKRSQLMAESSCRLIVDATHPHAATMSTQLIDLSTRLAIPYIRYERPSEALDLTTCTLVQNAKEAALLALNRGKRIFLATGVNHLEEILEVVGASLANWFVRITPDQQSLAKAVSLGIPRANICAMQGPFSVDVNCALWTQWQIDCVITKESGTRSGLSEKQIAARKLNLPLIVIKRPTINYPASSSNESAIFEYLNHQRRATCQPSFQ